MAKRVQLIRGATGTADAFTGLQGEITVDTTKKELRLHDGLTAGGVPHARADLANVNDATTSIAGKMSAADKTQLDADAVQVAANTAKLATIESGATADQTDAEIKTAYENNANTNAFTDAEQSKLAGIEAGATADQTAGEIKTAYESNADTNALTDARAAKIDQIANAALGKYTIREASTFTTLAAEALTDTVVSLTYTPSAIGVGLRVAAWFDIFIQNNATAGREFSCTFEIGTTGGGTSVVSVTPHEVRTGLMDANNFIKFSVSVTAFFLSTDTTLQTFLVRAEPDDNLAGSPIDGNMTLGASNIRDWSIEVQECEVTLLP